MKLVFKVIAYYVAPKIQVFYVEADNENEAKDKVREYLSLINRNTIATFVVKKRSLSLEHYSKHRMNSTIIN